MEENKKEKILIADDHPANLMLIENHLEGLGVDCVKALSGEAAIKAAAENDFALILLDVQMPEMNGFETAAILRAEEKTHFIPIIFITAMDHKTYEFKGYESGAVDYIGKPVDEEILRSKVKIFMELYRQKRIIESQRAELTLKVAELQKALDEIKVLRGIIPICVHCKKIRDDGGYWENVEQYIEAHSEVGFSHGICPECLKKHFPDIADEILESQAEYEKNKKLDQSEKS
ncbi:MAG: hypothetical protein A2020_09095 [Lentisphaerae bacterium GWF2_45_14]|nr:MAG: hypothetical protein A2020_09095 [Lentisphaerae bacterium GWF2_45_14]